MNAIAPHQAFASRLKKFLLVLGIALLLVYGVLPLITAQVPILARMQSCLDQSGIDPSRYYYTDVEQVSEGEHHLEAALRGR